MELAAVTTGMAWITALLLCVQLCLGLAHSRAMSLSRTVRNFAIWAHTGFGCALPVLTFAHAWFSMKSAPKASNMAGLWIATLALLFLILQVLIGIPLLRPRPEVSLRGAHLTVAGTVIVLAGVHVILNH